MSFEVGVSAVVELEVAKLFGDGVLGVPLGWAAAEEACQAMGSQMHLVSVTSAEQQQAVVQVEVYGLNSQEVIGMALVSLQLLVGEEAAMEQYTGVVAVVAVEELLSA